METGNLRRQPTERSDQGCHQLLTRVVSLQTSLSLSLQSKGSNLPISQCVHSHVSGGIQPHMPSPTTSGRTAIKAKKPQKNIKDQTSQ